MKFGKSLIIVLTLLFFGAGTARSFDCASPETPAKELKRATAVFAGKVVETRLAKITDASDEDFGGERVYVLLKVDRWWKGSGEQEVTLRTSRVYFPDGTYKEMAEGFNFSTGQSYLVYAFFYNGALGTSGCTRTTELSKAEEDLKELGESFLPEDSK